MGAGILVHIERLPISWMSEQENFVRIQEKLARPLLFLARVCSEIAADFLIERFHLPIQLRVKI